MKIGMRILALALLTGGLAAIAEAVGLPPVQAQTGSTGKCCVKAKEKQPDSPPTGFSCGATGWNPSNPGSARSTAVEASCSGLSSTMNCGPGSLSSTVPVDTYTYNYTCFAGVPGTRRLDSTVQTTPTVKQCSKDTCP